MGVEHFKREPNKQKRHNHYGKIPAREYANEGKIPAREYAHKGKSPHEKKSCTIKKNRSLGKKKTHRGKCPHEKMIARENANTKNTSMLDYKFLFLTATH